MVIENLWVIDNLSNEIVPLSMKILIVCVHITKIKETIDHI